MGIYEPKVIGRAIKKLRTQQNLTIEKLAYGAGISKGNLSEIEKGMHDIRITTLGKICECLELSPATFFEGL